MKKETRGSEERFLLERSVLADINMLYFRQGLKSLKRIRSLVNYRKGLKNNEMY